MLTRDIRWRISHANPFHRRENAQFSGPTQIYGTATLTALEPGQIASPDRSDILALDYNYLIFHVVGSNLGAESILRFPSPWRVLRTIIVQGKNIRSMRRRNLTRFKSRQSCGGMDLRWTSEFSILPPQGECFAPYLRSF